MKFNLINIEDWNRKEHYNHYLNNVRCTFSVTSNIDITKSLKYIKSNNLKFYPSIIYAIAKVVNNYSEFRTSYDINGRLGFWDEINPSFTIFNKETETFSDIWVKYDDSFNKFYENYNKEVDLYKDSKKLTPQLNTPQNVFPISSLPWVSFTGFNLNIFADSRFLLPIFTIGKYFEQNEKIMLPLSIQVHHAVCDGFHVSRFIGSLQDTMINYNLWLTKKEY
ncbi:type A chloramphenicol O-acetyltransferase [Metaclostridioides mangenotii]|uniref:type A chloramphenicol O-acetyltransferase n=1 Tax=Metaclostridioides mangenotii TaxID=1540 RepID=UPI0026EA86AD|nr:type A chloramphenicol O-acetyltransferase [Clostridioides mangenotii]